VWKEASLILKLIRPLMSRWWLRRGYWWFGALVVVLCLLSLTKFILNALARPVIYTSPGYLLHSMAEIIPIWLGCLVMAETLQALETSVMRGQYSGWISMRTLFLVFQRQLIPIVAWSAFLQGARVLATTEIHGPRSFQVVSLAVTDVAEQLLYYCGDILLTLLWLSALVAISTKLLHCAKLIIALQLLAKILWLFVILPLQSSFGATDEMLFLRRGTGTALVSLAFLSLWLVSARLGLSRRAWASLANWLFLLVAFIPVLLHLTSVALLFVRQSTAAQGLAMALHSVVFLFGMFPRDGAVVAGWLSAHVAGVQLGPSYFVNSCALLYGYLWIVLAYAVVWGPLLRPDRAQRENQLTTMEEAAGSSAAALSQ
jgi:hypothetical protein